MLFEIKALRNGEGVCVLSIAAANESDAANVAKGQGYAVLSVKAAGDVQALFKPRRTFPLVLFSQELLSLLDAGLSLIEAFVALTNKEHNPESKKVLDAIISRLYEGQALSAALQEFPSVFPPLYVASMRASEKTGGLGEALSRFVVRKMVVADERDCDFVIPARQLMKTELCRGRRDYGSAVDLKVQMALALARHVLGKGRINDIDSQGLHLDRCPALCCLFHRVNQFSADGRRTGLLHAWFCSGRCQWLCQGIRGGKPVASHDQGKPDEIDTSQHRVTLE